MLFRTIALPAAACVVTLVAGCGGGDEPKRPSKSAYIAQADAICTKGNAALQEASKVVGNDPSEKDIEKFGLEVFIPNLEGQVAQLRKLRAPEGDDGAVAAVWDAAQEGLDGLKGDPAEFVRAGTPEAFKKTQRLAHAYGFKVCGASNS